MSVVYTSAQVKAAPSGGSHAIHKPTLLIGYDIVAVSESVSKYLK